MGQYEEIYVHVVCKHPSNIPLEVKFRQGGHSTYVQVYLYKWRPIQHSPFNPPPFFPSRGGAQQWRCRHDGSFGASNLPDQLSCHISSSPSWPPNHNQQHYRRRAKPMMPTPIWVLQKIQREIATENHQFNSIERGAFALLLSNDYTWPTTTTDNQSNPRW
jgi:hypothetical protein